MSRVPRAKQRTPELRDRVLDVAVTALNEHGISDFTTRRVAELAGTSVPAVYELFEDKAGLVRQMFFEGFRLLGRELATALATDDRWPMSKDSRWYSAGSACSAQPSRR
jgi:AcrR family transcriptional regulator